MKRLYTVIAALLSVLFTFSDRHVFGEKMNAEQVQDTFGGDYVPPGDDKTALAEAKMEKTAKGDEVKDGGEKKPDSETGKEGDEAGKEAGKEAGGKEADEQGKKGDEAGKERKDDETGKEAEGKKGDEEDKTTEEITDETVIKFGKKEITGKELSELISDAQQHYGAEEFGKLTPALQMKVLEDRMHIKEASKAANQRHQQNAAERKEIENYKKELESQRGDVMKKLSDIKDGVKLINEKKAELKKIIDAKAEDLEESEMIKFYSRQDRAAEKLADLENTEKEVTGLYGRTIEEAQAIEAAMTVTQLQVDYPELKTERPIYEILYDFREGIEVSDDELKVAKRIKRVLEDYYKDVSEEKRTKVTITKWYKSEKDNYPELKLTKEPGKSGKKSLKELREENVKDVLATLIERQKQNPPAPSGGGSTGRDDTNPASAKTSKAINDAFSAYNKEQFLIEKE